ncbi:MAG TPA: hypothetical protein VK486_10895 [Thermoleophilaceae bacterium]|nr:hypothetical protein [Thermoleophilaceae bacterium]
MTDALIRAVVAVPVAVLLPLAWHACPGRLVRAAFAAVLVAGALAPHFDDWQTWAIVGVTAVAVTIPRSPSFDAPLLPLGMTAGLLLLAVGLIDPAAAWDSVEDVGRSRDLVLGLAGALFAIFLAGEVIGRVLHPFAKRVRGETDTLGMENAGRYIGWLERALLYGLILIGSPDAAALVVAAKSIARFPSFAEEKFAEYYLIGTLLSLLIAAATAFAVRAAMGLDPLA